MNSALEKRQREAAMGEAILGVGAVLVVCFAIWWVAERALDKQKIGRVEGDWPKKRE